jgi:hypothetical protein
MASNDLTEPIPNPVLENQTPPTGQRSILEINGVLHEYYHEDWFARADRFSKRLDAEMKWIEEFVSHASSVGNYYEGITRDMLAEFLPSGVRVGTGFIFDSLRRRCSPQLDILIYSDLKESPIYRRGEFVIVQPASVVGICEVKKTLRSADLSDWIDKTISQNLGWHIQLPYGIQQSSLFAFSSNVSTKTLARTVVKSIRKFVQPFHAKTQDGKIARMGGFYAALPAIYLRDRAEYISVSAVKHEYNSPTYELSVEILHPGGAPGVTPLLTSINDQIDDPAKRNLVGGFLVEVVSKTTIEDNFLLMRRLTTSEMLRYFDDASEILSTLLVNGKRPIAAVVPSWALPEHYNSLAEYSRIDLFSWEFV